jgi:hypothetical protein
MSSIRLQDTIHVKGKRVPKIRDRFSVSWYFPLWWCRKNHRCEVRRSQQVQIRRIAGYSRNSNSLHLIRNSPECRTSL